MTALSQCCDRDIGSWGSKVMAPACPRHQESSSKGCPSRDGHCPVDGQKGEANSQIWSVPRMTFFQCFALHLPCTDPWEDREDVCLPPGSFSARFQLLTLTNRSPGPGNLFPCNLTLGNTWAILDAIPSHSKINNTKASLWLTFLGNFSRDLWFGTLQTNYTVPKCKKSVKGLCRVCYLHCILHFKITETGSPL